MIFKKTLYLLLIFYSFNSNADLFTITGGEENSGSDADGSKINAVFLQPQSYNNYNDVKNVIDQVNQPSNPFYQILNTNNSANGSTIIPEGVINGSFLGSNVDLSGALNSPALHLSSSQLNINQTFNGQTRAESLNMFKEWVKNNASSLSQQANSQTPLNPVVGTPAGAVNMMQNENSLMTLDTSTSTVLNGNSGNNSISGNNTNIDNSRNVASISARFGNYSIENKQAQSITVPLGYTINFANKYSLIFNVPLTYATIANVPSYSASLGIGLKVPLSNILGMEHNWSITPMVRGGAVGSDKNIISTSAIYSGGLLSEYDLPFANGILGFKNMYSYFVTTSITQYLDLKINNVRTSIPDINNSIFRNALYYSSYFGSNVLDRKLSGTIFFADTRYTGSAIYSDYQEEVGITLGLSPKIKADSTNSFLRRQLDAQDFNLGISYITGRSFDGFTANFGLNF